MNNERNELYAKSLSLLIQKETVSVAGEKNQPKFMEFHELLKEMFPTLFAAAELEDFDGSLLLKWNGKGSGKAPMMFMSHHDVVEAPGEWTYPPFSGQIAEGKVWGRGTLDTKGSLWAMFQAAEELMKEGFVPGRDIYFESARTEETDGAGANRISKILRKRGVRFYMTIDEGGMMLYDPIGGADGTFAMIGVGEKGCADLKFIARSDGGHASTPGKNTPLVRLGKFMAAMEKSSIFDVELAPVIQEMFERIAPTTKGPMKAALSKAGSLKPLLCKVLPGISPTVGAMLKTTIAFTMCHGSEGRNVLPQEAYVIGNMRYSHHQGKKASINAVRRLALKYGIETEIIQSGFESPITDYNGEPFRFVERAVREVFPGVIPTPYLMTGASDSRFFSRVSDHCIRFAPFLITGEQLDSIHGIDENVDVATLSGAVDFYKYMMKEA